MKKSSVALLLGIIFLTLIGVQGTLLMRNGRCSCINTSQRMIHLKSLRDLKQFTPSPSCEKMEVIATMKNGDQTCLNPDSPDVKKLIKEWEKQVSLKKKQKKGKKHPKTKKVRKVKKSQRPDQKKMT
ncbi:C-X-C motif chemokine 9 [Phacochoerus africanus]|uniref:C-X-C motif chemokine 9 n=1 Tax=Phacochoerus africanus TaxID=41426 RepID=UPI001FDA5B14|nr:C-X-C motif chemokine 9 [Phacochoerus africanus]